MEVFDNPARKKRSYESARKYEFQRYFPPSPLFISFNGQILSLSMSMLSYSYSLSVFFSSAEKDTYFFSNIFLFPSFSFLRDIEYDLPITPVILYHINFHVWNFLAQFGLVYAFQMRQHLLISSCKSVSQPVIDIFPVLRLAHLRVFQSCSLCEWM